MDRRSTYNSSSSRGSSYGSSSSRSSYDQRDSSTRNSSISNNYTDDEFFDEDDYYEERSQRSSQRSGSRSGRTSINDSRNAQARKSQARNSRNNSRGGKSSGGNLSKYSTYNKNGSRNGNSGSVSSNSGSIGSSSDSRNGSRHGGSDPRGTAYAGTRNDSYNESHHPQYLDDRGSRKSDVYSYKSKPSTGHLSARKTPPVKDKRRDLHNKRKITYYIYLVVAAALLVGSVPINKVVFDKVMESDMDIQVIPDFILNVVPLNIL